MSKVLRVGQCHSTYKRRSWSYSRYDNIPLLVFIVQWSFLCCSSIASPASTGRNAHSPQSRRRPKSTASPVILAGAYVYVSASPPLRQYNGIPTGAHSSRRDRHCSQSWRSGTMRHRISTQLRSPPSHSLSAVRRQWRQKLCFMAGRVANLRRPAQVYGPCLRRRRRCRGSSPRIL